MFARYSKPPQNMYVIFIKQPKVMKFFCIKFARYENVCFHSTII